MQLTAFSNAARRLACGNQWSRERRLGNYYTGTTTDKGVYYINYILPGNYNVTAEVQGFKTAEQDKVVLSTAQTFNQNFKMEVGSVGESVVVITEPPQLETSTGSGGTLLTARDLENVP